MVHEDPDVTSSESLVTNTDKDYVANRWRDFHRQPVLPFSPPGLVIPPAVLAIQTETIKLEDGAPTIRLCNCFFAYPESITAGKQVVVNPNENAVSIFASSTTAIADETVTRIELGDLRIVRPIASADGNE